jgi:DNA-binding transcriptional MerR regulator
MARQREFTEAQLLAALDKSRGLLKPAATALGCSLRTVHRYCDRYPSLREHIEDLREARVDLAELKLEEAIGRGEPWAIALTLKTLGRKRGYTERIETEAAGEIKYVIEYVNDWRDGKPA